MLWEFFFATVNMTYLGWARTEDLQTVSLMLQQLCNVSRFNINFKSHLSSSIVKKIKSRVFKISQRINMQLPESSESPTFNVYGDFQLRLLTFKPKLYILQKVSKQFKNLLSAFSNWLLWSFRDLDAQWLTALDVQMIL